MPDDDGLRPRWRTLAPSLTETFISSENWRKRFLQNENRSGVTVQRENLTAPANGYLKRRRK